MRVADMIVPESPNVLLVMPRLDPGIHVLTGFSKRDGRIKSGHDEHP